MSVDIKTIPLPTYLSVSAQQVHSNPPPPVIYPYSYITIHNTYSAYYLAIRCCVVVLLCLYDYCKGYCNDE